MADWGDVLKLTKWARTRIGRTKLDKVTYGVSSNADVANHVMKHPKNKIRCCFEKKKLYFYSLS